MPQCMGLVRDTIIIFMIDWKPQCKWLQCVALQMILFESLRLALALSAAPTKQPTAELEWADAVARANPVQGGKSDNGKEEHLFAGGHRASDTGADLLICHMTEGPFLIVRKPSANDQWTHRTG